MEVFLIAALTADGFLGRDENHSSISWRSKEDSRFFITKTKQAGALVMGSRTFATMKKPMPFRKHYILTSNPSNFSNYDREIVVPISATPLDLIDRARKDGCHQLAICGGSSVYTQFVEADVVDKFYLTVEPIFFGQGVGLFNHSMAKNLNLNKVHQIGINTIVLEYEKKKNE